MIKDIKEFLENRKIYPVSLNDWLIFLSIISIGTLITGFVVWNIYLYFLGFVEDEIVQSRFIITGILFWLITLFTVWIFKSMSLLDSLFLKIKSRIWSICLSLFLWTIFYCLFIFPIIPLFLGGGQPKSLAIIADVESMEIIKSFEIIQPENAPYQTESLCVAYESDKKLVLLRKNRILGIDKLNVEGMVSLPGAKQAKENECINLAYGWVWQGFVFSFILLLNQIFKWQSIIFFIFGSYIIILIIYCVYKKLKK